MKITLTGLRALDDGSLIAVSVLIEAEGGAQDKRIYHILPEQYVAMKLRKGAIDCETVDALEEASRLCEAIRKGMQLLAYGAQSEKTLQYKLRTRGFTAEQATAAANYLSRQGLMDESADAMRLAEGCRRKRWGMRRILSCLYEKGYSDTAIRAVQEQLEGEDFVPDCVALIRAKYREIPKDREDRQKMMAALMRYGYSLGEIRWAMEMLGKNEHDGEEMKL